MKMQKRSTEVSTAQESPDSVDAWTGEIAEIGEYTIEDGRTSLELTLEPGASAIVALDLNDPG